MRTRFFLFCVALFGCLLLASCANEAKETKPAQLIPEEKFAELLADVRLLEGAYAGDFQRVDTSEYAIGAYYEQLFAKHQTTRSIYLESNSYYANHSEAMLRIETEVARRLETMSEAAMQ
jgi:hypothetical protein